MLVDSPIAPDSPKRTTRVHLIRHAESKWSAEGRVQGQADPPLSPKGIQQAEALAGALRGRSIRALYCSPLARAYETAMSIAKACGRHPEVVDNLQEIDLGAWQGLTRAEMSSEMKTLHRQWRANPLLVRPPGGETLEEALTRGAESLHAILEAHKNQKVAIVTHSILGRALLAHLLGASLEIVPRLRLRPTSISMLRIGANGAVLELLGDTSHLHGDIQ